MNSTDLAAMSSRPYFLPSVTQLYKATWKEMYVIFMDKSVNYKCKVGTALLNLYPYVSTYMEQKFKLTHYGDYLKGSNVETTSVNEDKAIAVVIMIVFSYAYSQKDLRRTNLMERYKSVMMALKRNVLTKVEFDGEMAKIDFPVDKTMGSLTAAVGKVLVGTSVDASLFIKHAELPNYDDILNGTPPCPVSRAVRINLAEMFKDFQQKSLKHGLQIINKLEKYENGMDSKYKREYQALKKYSCTYNDADYAGLVENLSETQRISAYPRIILTGYWYVSDSIDEQSSYVRNRIEKHINSFLDKQVCKFLGRELKRSC